MFYHDITIITFFPSTVGNYVIYSAGSPYWEGLQLTLVLAQRGTFQNFDLVWWDITTVFITLDF